MYYMYGVWVWEVYYTILYYTIPHSYTYTQLTRMFDVYLKVYNGMEREKMEKRVRVSTSHIRLLLLLLYVSHYKDMISSIFPSILFDSHSPPPHFYNPFPCILSICSNREKRT